VPIVDLREFKLHVAFRYCHHNSPRRDLMRIKWASFRHLNSLANLDIISARREELLLQ